MRVEEVMSRKLVTVEPDDSLRHAAELMSEHHVSGLPVVAAGDLVGVVTESDFVTLSSGKGKRRWVDALLGRGDSLEDVSQVGDIMTPEPVTVAPDRRLRDAARIMIDANVKRLPVVDEAGTLLGIVSRADLMRSFVRSDDEIGEEIQDALHEYIVRGVEVGVTDGVVTLEGTVALRSGSRLAEELVRRIDGVVSVNNHLTWQADELMM